METIDKNRKWLDFSLLSVIFTLAWPTMIEQVMQTAVQYIDTAMVGRLGIAATAAVGSTSTINWLVGSTISALGIGFLAFISQAIGAGLEDKAIRAAGQAVGVVLVVGTIFTVVTLSLSGAVPRWMQADEQIRETASRYFFILYLPMLPRTASIIFGTCLRAAGDTKTPMKVSVMMNGLNVVLNFLLIYRPRTVQILGLPVRIWGAGWGVTGAAIASAAAFTVGGILIAVRFWNHPLLSPKKARLTPDMEILRPCFQVAFPNMLQRFCTSLGYVVFAAMINSSGGLSTAAHTIANTVESAFYIPGFGMQAAAATLTGNAVGARDRERMHRMERMIVLSEVAMMMVTGSLLFAFAPAIVALFTSDGEVIRLGGTVLRMVALSEPFYGISIVTEGILQGAGQTRMPFVFNLICMWGVRILGTFICIRFFGLGLIAAWACMIADNMLLLLLFRLYYRFGSWNRMVFDAWE